MAEEPCCGCPAPPPLRLELSARPRRNPSRFPGLSLGEARRAPAEVHVSSSDRRRGPTTTLAIALATAALAVAASSAAYWAARGPSEARSAGRAPSASPSATAFASASPAAASSALPGDTILAWISGGLPPGFAAAVRRIPGVANVVVVGAGTAWLARTRSASGRTVTSPPRGMFVPVEVAAADPAALAPFWPPALQPALAALGRGEAVLGTTSAGIRRLGPGGELIFSRASRLMFPLRVRVGAVVPDAAVGAAGGRPLFSGRETRCWHR